VTLSNSKIFNDTEYREASVTTELLVNKPISLLTLYFGFRFLELIHES